MICSDPAGGRRKVTQLVVDSPCPPGERVCRNQQCVRQELFCDGRRDCLDGSDEREDLCAPVRCVPGQFTCTSGECIDEPLKCDGRQDCFDGSDERGCDIGPPPLPESLFARPKDPAEFVCHSTQHGFRPTLTLENGTLPEHLPRFAVARPSTEVVRARLTSVSEQDHGLKMICSDPTGGQRKVIQLNVESPCPPGERMCQNQQCVRQELFCNGRRDCLDGSDEREDLCGQRCLASQFQCESGECLDPRQRCDGRQDCRDFTDELGCDRKCLPNQFRCESGECLDPIQRCDGRRDCGDASDERNCDRLCLPTQFQCDSGECLEQRQRCDGRQDCRDGSDEAGCADRRCLPTQFQCGSGECLEQSQRCDGREDCRDGLDEALCVDRRCPVTQFQCGSGECLEQRQRCDGRQDCRDFSDEVGCADRRCLATQFQCGSGECLEQRQRCDGRQDCRDGSDEAVCDRRCLPKQFQCGSGECVEQRQRCDGRQDCRDGADEAVCDRRCLPTQFLCGSGECIEQRQRCDGRQDCRDGSDEAVCVSGPVIRPDRIHVRPYGYFEVTCESRHPGIRPELQLANGTSLEQVDRFAVTRPSPQVITAGMANVDELDQGLKIRCRYPTGESAETMISVETPCNRSERMCRDGRCLPAERFCDGRRDCSDGSDEQSIRCVRRCSPTQFQCGSGECIDARQECDGRQDCRDFSDEAECDRQCLPSQFACGSGECLDARQRCDGRPDCQDRTDEMECGLGPIIDPGRIFVRPYEKLDVECRSRRPGTRLDFHLANGTALDQLGRFHVIRPDPDVIVARLATVTELDNGLVIVCSYPTGESTQAHVIVNTPCGPSDMMCRDGTCLPRNYFCNGIRECRDGSDEQPPYCAPAPQSMVEITPDRIQAGPYKPFKLNCISHNPQIRPYARLADGRLLAEDPRFQVIHVTPNHLEIRAEHGLTERDDKLEISCVFPSVGNRSSIIHVLRPCPTGQYQCKDGTCMNSDLFCNGKPDCPDRSDESERFCRIDVNMTTGSVITVRPFEPFRFECRSAVKGTAPLVLIDGQSVDNDPLFKVTRPSPEQIVVTASHGVPDRGGHVVQCLSVTGDRKQMVVRLQPPACPPGQAQCSSSRECVPIRSFCDGIYDCSDRSDEDPRTCDTDLCALPSYMYTYPHTPVEFLCETRDTDVEPQVRFADGRDLSTDPRFAVTRPSRQRVLVRVESGLTERDNNTQIVCSTPKGTKRDILIQINSRCPPHHATCRDGTCRPIESFCDGKRDCPDGTDEDPKCCGIHVTVKPGAIRVRPNEPFTYECRSNINGIRPNVTINGQPAEQHPQLRVERPTTERVVITAPSGMPESGIHVMGCSIPMGPPHEVLLAVDGACEPGKFDCQDGTCVAMTNVCDGRRDCPNGRDEDTTHCVVRPPGRISFTPGELRIQPGRPLRLECSTDMPGASLDVRFADGRPLITDPQFVVRRPHPMRIEVTAPQGLSATKRQVVLICQSSTGDHRNATITVDQSCQPGQRRCPGGDCIFAGQFCDGNVDCEGGYDERTDMCAVCDPIAKPCEAVNGREPSVPHFQLHWTCDGENDCGNGFDELNCKNNTRNIDPQCGSTHFRCTSGAKQYVPFSYWCDGTMDCANGEDEQECFTPAFIESGNTQTYRVRPGQTLVLECEASGMPPPMIIWRFNWNCLPDPSRMQSEVISSARGCRGSRSRLTIRHFRPGDDGIYNCEALRSSHRAMSQDMLVLLAD